MCEIFLISVTYATLFLSVNLLILLVFILSIRCSFKFEYSAYFS